MTITPPEHELRPEARARQRAQLTAIVAHEAARTPRRRLAPLAAAAAVVAVTTGLAVGLPALRDDNGQPAVSGTTKTQPATVEPLSEAEKMYYGKLCSERSPMRLVARQPVPYRVVDGFRFANAPGDAYTTTWVVISGNHLAWTTCGVSSEGTIHQAFSRTRNGLQFHAVDARMIGAGAYAAHVTRITIAIGNREPVDAVLRGGFFYAPVPYVRVRGPHTDATPLPYTIRGYDAAGRLVYSSPMNDGEWRAQRNACYVDPKGELVAWTTGNPHPDPKLCRRSFIWNYQPR